MAYLFTCLVTNLLTFGTSVVASLTRSAGKTSVSFAEQRRIEVATVFSDFPLLVFVVVLLLLVPVYK